MWPSLLPGFEPQLHCWLMIWLYPSLNHFVPLFPVFKWDWLQCLPHKDVGKINKLTHIEYWEQCYRVSKACVSLTNNGLLILLPWAFQVHWNGESPCLSMPEGTFKEHPNNCPHVTGRKSGLRCGHWLVHSHTRFNGRVQVSWFQVQISPLHHTAPMVLFIWLLDQWLGNTLSWDNGIISCIWSGEETEERLPVPPPPPPMNL